MHTVTSADGTRLAYSTIGNGPEIVIVLGALNSRKSGTKLAKVLASDFAVTTYDRRGRGSSTDTTPYAPEREVEDLQAVIDDRGGNVDIYGHSSGAAIVLRAAAMNDGRVRRAAIYEPPYMTTEAEVSTARDYDRQLRSALANEDLDTAVSLFLAHVGVSEKQTTALKQLPMWKGLTMLAPTLAYDSEVLGDGQAVPYDTAARITAPFLAMCGAKSPASMHAAVTALGSSITNARRAVLPGQDHGVSPAAIGPLLVEFFTTPLTVTKDGTPVAELRPVPQRSLPGAELIARARRAPKVDADLLRRDIDSDLDQRL